MSDKFGLDEAYAVETPEDNKRLYAAWAATYDEDFLVSTGYIYARGVAAMFAADGSGPVLDIGCGTGAVGIGLSALNIGPVDGVDISAEMVDVARSKRLEDQEVYRDLFVGDLTVGLSIPDGGYAGVVSAGTFTHGHLGPEVLPEVVRVGAPGCRFAIGVNAEHYETRGFESTLEGLVAAERITNLTSDDVAIYENNTTEHGQDRALVVRFVKP